MLIDIIKLNISSFMLQHILPGQCEALPDHGHHVLCLAHILSHTTYVTHGHPHSLAGGGGDEFDLVVVFVKQLSIVPPGQRGLRERLD